jgi:hypothetical protein
MYKGALFWRMKAGMGDVVFAPMYLALRHRGVKFRFFHRLDDIELDPTGRTVTRLKFWRQVRLKTTDPDAPTNYEPLALAGRIPGWRGTPDARQFAHDGRVAEAYARASSGDDEKSYLNFESIWCTWPHGDPVYATVGDTADAPQDPSCVGQYDEVIVTVPVAALGRVSQQLAASPTEAGRRWQDMLGHLATVATQSMQIWVTKETRGLGWMHGQVSFSAFVHPFDTWADLSHLTRVERTGARGVHYFCSVLPDREIRRIGGDPSRVAGELRDVKTLVKENAKRFLNEWIFQLWPDAVDRYPNVFRWQLLLDSPRPPRSAPRRPDADRLDAQHIVANVDPSERYTQSLPGTTKYRIRPDDTGFARLVIAGDWTDCGLNFGCVEAAVISGRLASSAVTGYPDARLIPNHLRSAARAAAQGGS